MAHPDLRDRLLLLRHPPGMRNVHRLEAEAGMLGGKHDQTFKRVQNCAIGRCGSSGKSLQLQPRLTSGRRAAGLRPEHGALGELEMVRQRMAQLQPVRNRLARLRFISQWLRLGSSGKTRPSRSSAAKASAMTSIIGVVSPPTRWSHRKLRQLSPWAPGCCGERGIAGAPGGVGPGGATGGPGNPGTHAGAPAQVTVFNYPAASGSHQTSRGIG